MKVYTIKIIRLFQQSWVCLISFKFSVLLCVYVRFHWRKMNGNNNFKLWIFISVSNLASVLRKLGECTIEHSLLIGKNVLHYFPHVLLNISIQTWQLTDSLSTKFIWQHNWKKKCKQCYVSLNNLYFSRTFQTMFLSVSRDVGAWLLYVNSIYSNC